MSVGVMAVFGRTMEGIESRRRRINDGGGNGFPPWDSSRCTSFRIPSVIIWITLLFSLSNFSVVYSRRK